MMAEISDSGLKPIGRAKKTKKCSDFVAHLGLGGGFKDFFYFHPYLGKISDLTNIFQMG